MRKHRCDGADEDVEWTSMSRTAAGSLFDRLVIDEEDEDAPLSNNPVDAQIRSIQRNLERVLNIHTGSAASAPDLGVENFNDASVSVGDVSRNMTAMVQSCILNYEPRISDVQVTFVPDPDDQLTLRFSIVAEVVVSDEREQIRFDMAMKNGRFRMGGR